MHMSDSLPDKRIIVINEAGQDISLLHEDPGTEIQYTKDFGCGLDVHSKFIQVSVQGCCKVNKLKPHSEFIFQPMLTKKKKKNIWSV